MTAKKWRNWRIFGESIENVLQNFGEIGEKLENSPKNLYFLRIWFPKILGKMENSPKNFWRKWRILQKIFGENGEFSKKNFGEILGKRPMCLQNFGEFLEKFSKIVYCAKKQRVCGFFCAELQCKFSIFC